MINKEFSFCFFKRLCAFFLFVPLFHHSADALTPEHEECLDRLYCKYGAWSSSAQKSYKWCLEAIEFQKGGMDPGQGWEECCYKLRKSGFSLEQIRNSRRLITDCMEKLLKKTTSSKTQEPSKPRTSTPRKLSAKEQEAEFQRWKNSLMPTAEQELERRRQRDAKWEERERAEKARIEREKKQWENRPAAERERRNLEIADVQNCLFQFQQEGFEPPPGDFQTSGECLSALASAREKSARDGGRDAQDRIGACLSRLKKIGYPVSAGAKTNYLTCKNELKNAETLLADIGPVKTEVSKRTEEQSLKECLKIFDEEKLPLSTNDITTLEGCQRRLAKAREMKQKKDDNAETNRLLGLISSEKDITKQLPLIKQIPIESFREDELARWNMEKDAVDNCLIQFSNMGIQPPDGASLNSAACRQAFGKVKEDREAAEREARAKKDKEEFQQAVENNLKKLQDEKEAAQRAAQNQKTTSTVSGEKPVSAESSGKEKDGEPAGEVFPANLPGVDIKNFHILHGGDITEKVKFLENVTAGLEKDPKTPSTYRITVKWRYINWNAAIHTFSTILQAPHGISMAVYSTYDRAGKLFKTKLADTSSPFVTFEGNQKTELVAFVPASQLPRKENHIWLKVIVIIARAKEDSDEWKAEEMIYAGKIVK